MIEDLNPQQHEAATYDGEAKNILVVAGAGTGKTKTMISRAYFLQKYKMVDPSRILCLTFTNNAAKEIVARLDAQIAGNSENIWASTFHSFCIKVIKMIPKSFGYESLPTIINASSQASLMKACFAVAMSEMEIDEDDKSKLPKSAIILKEYSFARNAQKTMRKQLKDTITDDELVLDFCDRVILEYEKEKEEYQYVDFDDILIRFVEKTEEKPELSKAISELFDEVLVDELQDTNPIQYRILKALSRGNARIFGVGDPAQSIYGFRGADFASIYNFESIFENSKRINLSINYRSYQEILDNSNLLMDNSTLTYDNHLQAHRGHSNNKSELLDFDTSIEEATFIAKDIIAYHEEGGNFNDIYVITRSGYSARDIEGLFKQKNIPYEVVGGLAINKTSHVQDMLSLLQMLVNKNDKLASMRFLTLFKGVGEKSALKMFMKIKDATSNSEVIDIIEKGIPKDRERAIAMVSQTMKAIDNNGNPITAMMMGGFESLIKDIYLDNYEYRVNDINTIASMYRQFKGDTQSFLNDFTLEPSLAKEEDETEDKDAVTIITAHSAKGLENKICYVTKLCPGYFPSKRSIGSKKDEEEERRVAYVALTRARDRLVVTRVMDYLSTFFPNAKTEIDFMKPIVGSFNHQRKKMISNEKSLGGLRDIY